MVVGSPTKLNLIPSGVMPVVYINQSDAGYDKEFVIYNGDSPYNVPAGVSATIRGKKADGYGVTETAALTEGSNLVTVTVTEQMVAAAGANLYELVFVDTDGLRIATINMVWAVKPDALGDAVISESDLDYATQVMDELQSVQAFKNQLDTTTDGLAAETAARIAADDTERAARISADNTLQANINSEAAARSAQDGVLQAEIDQLIAPSGSAPSAAEVQNARIGADGVTYDTLGNAIRTQVTELKNALDGNYYNAARIKNSYVETNGVITSYNGYTRTDYIPISEPYIIIDVASGQSGSSRYNCFYDIDKNFISSFRVYGDNPYENGITGFKNVIKVPTNAKYFMCSGTNAFMANTGIVNTKYRSNWTWLIASENSECASIADCVCYGTIDDGYRINRFMSDHGGDNDVYCFAPDSVFNLKSPISPYSNTKLKSAGAVFTQPNMSITTLQADATQGNTIIEISDIALFSYIGMWIYIEDDDGYYESNYIVNYNTNTNTLTLKYQLGHSYTTAKNTVIKTANSCILITADVENVEIDGIKIDWNVANNPMQTYNPDFVQDGVSIDQAKNVRIKNCTILNGGRRGICGYDATNILVENCYIKNWSEHGIDWYCTRGKNGNTATLPILIDAKVINTVCCNNALCGIQNHRGSGVSIIGCELYENAHGLRMQEYAHDVTVVGCIIRDNTGTGVNILSNSNKLSLVGNVITKNASDGIQGVAANRLLIGNNQISRNGQRGVYLENTHRCEVTGNQISDNNLSTDPSNSPWYFAGIGLVNSNYNKVANNYCSKDDGDMAYGVYERSSSNYNVMNDNYILGAANSVYKTGANSVERNNDLFA